MLDEFETKEPANAIPSLKCLARLSLCQDYHQGQALGKVDEWEVAIQDAIQFYESGRSLKEKNRELKEMLREERSEREGLEQQLETEISQRKQELRSMGSMSMEMSSLRAKLKQAGVEARESKEVAQKMSRRYDKCVAGAEERISVLLAEWHDENQKIKTELQKEVEMSRSIGSELMKLKANEIILLNQASDLILQLETEVDGNSTLQSELVQVKSERALALSQKDDLRSQLEIAAEEMDRTKLSLREVGATRDALSEEEQCLHAQLSIERQSIKDIGNAKAQLEEKYAGLVQEVGTLNAQLSSEWHNVAELRKSLQTTADNLSNTHTQLRTVEENLSHNKDELEKLQVEIVKVRHDAEEEKRKLDKCQAVSLARIDELIQEITWAKLHPFKKFFASVSEVTIGWVKSVFAYFGRLRIRKAVDPPIMEENI